MKLTIEMNEVEKKKFDEMCEQMKRLEIALMGTSIVKGFVQEMREAVHTLITDFGQHKIDDLASFKKVFETMAPLQEYQLAQKLYVRWTGKAIGILIATMLAIGGFAGWLITTLISLK